MTGDSNWTTQGVCIDNVGGNLTGDEDEDYDRKGADEMLYES